MMNVKQKKFIKKKIEHPDHYEAMGVEWLVTPITILLGPNGTGKSMSLRTIESECKRDGINCIRFGRESNDIVRTDISFDPYKLACAFHSEGERICDSINNWANSELLRELLTNKKDLYVLVDELDSGLSSDRLIDQISMYLSILTMEKEKHPKRIVKLIFTCNTFEMLECFKEDRRVTVYWVPTKQRYNLKEYPDYESFRNMYVDYFNYKKEMTKEED